jgi:signal transduction histidine kinase
VAVLLLFSPLSRWLERRVGGLFSGEIRKFREMGEAIQRAAPTVPAPALFKELVEEKLRRELETSQVKIHLQDLPRPLEGEALYPLQVADLPLGYLEVRHPQTHSGGEREAMRLLANQIAAALERCHFIGTQTKLEQELAQKSYLEELGRMTAAVAHNVKNPLSSIKTLMQLMLEADNLTLQQREEIAMVLKEIDRLAQTVGSLLKFSRAQSQTGQPSAMAQAVDLRQLIDSLGAVFEGDLRSRKLCLEIGRTPCGPLPCADTEAVGEILGNLLSNAIEASPDHGTIRVRIFQAAGTADAGTVSIEIEDEGPGIPVEVRDRLFEPFVTTKPKGTGLGLAIVRKRVEQLKGSVTYTSPVDSKGARFTVKLPTGALSNRAESPT